MDIQTHDHQTGRTEVHSVQPRLRSLEAFASIQPHLGPMQETIYKFVKMQPRGVTSEQISEGLGMRIQSVTARVLELREMYLLKDSGEKRSTSSGRNATVWTLPKQVTN